MNKNTNTTITRSTVTTRQLSAMGRAERDLIQRHEEAMRRMDQLDATQERPHRPKLANEVLRMDDAAAVNWDSPVIQAMARKSDPQVGPRTATHPMAVPISREMATRVRPHIHESRNPIYYRPVFWGAVDLTIIAAVVAFAWWLA
jgi:hypothetical protein